MAKLKIILFHCLLINIYTFGQDNVSEKVFTEIKIQGIECIDQNKDCQFSGLAWHGDDLFLMPQFPKISDRKSLNGYFYKISRESLKKAIVSNRPVNAFKIDVILDNNLYSKIPRGNHEGYEAILFDKDNVYALIESKWDTKSHLIKGTIRNDSILFSEYLDEFKSNSRLRNMAKEAMTLIGSDLLIIDEVNCSNQFAQLFSLNKEENVQKIDLPVIQNRITDATMPDNENRFWVSNFLFYNNGIGDDSEILNHCNATSSESKHHLYQLKYDPTNRRIEVMDQSIRVIFNGTNNWEGIERFDATTLLLINDDYPSDNGKTKFGFVKLD